MNTNKPFKQKKTIKKCVSQKYSHIFYKKRISANEIKFYYPKQLNIFYIDFSSLGF